MTTSWAHLLLRADWSELRRPGHAALLASALARRAGWNSIPDLAAADLRPGLRAVAPWLARLDPATARAHVLRARQVLGSLGSSLPWPRVLGSGRRRERALSAEEARVLLSSFPCSASASLARWLYLTGARPGEARATRWSDFSGDVWRVPGSKTEAARRALPLDEAQLGVLPPRGPASQRVWALSDWEWRRAWAAGVLASGLEGPDLTPYVLRHTFATRALELGWTYEQVAAWMGHANGDTLRRHYRHAVAARPGIGVALSR